MSSSIPVGGSSSAPPVPKNLKGNRNDIAWKHGVSVDGGTRQIKCNYCGKVVIGGVYRLKHHLGHTQCNVSPCESVPDDVKVQMFEIYVGDVGDEFQKMLEMVARHGLGFKPPSYHEIRTKYLKQKMEETTKVLEEHKLIWKKTGCTIMSDGWTDKRRRTILNFLVNSPKGTIFLKSVDASHITKTADKIFELIDQVVEEVGEENVVQIVTDNAANYKAAGAMLMDKRKKLYWTPCAAHCIDLMLEDFEKKTTIHRETIARGKKVTQYIYSKTSLISLLQIHTKGKDLVRPAVTRFATSYLTLACLMENKGALIRMFTSNQWTSSKFSKTVDGKQIEEVVMDKGFWKDIIICLKGAGPLIKVLRMVDSEEELAMGLIYEAMDHAKEKIQANFNSVQRSYKPLWDIIDDRWDKQMHRPLHAAGYYLNPKLHYGADFKADFEVKRGLYDCLERMIGDVQEISKIDAQLEAFKTRANFFGSPIAMAALGTKIPAQWWESYGDEHPELQKFAIRVLSLTCSSSGCERNWSAFEMIHTKRRNRLKQKTMNDVVFVMTNSKLAKKKKARKVADFTLDDIDSDNEWIVEDEGSAENEILDFTIESEDLEGGTQNEPEVAAATVEEDECEVHNLDDEFEGNEDCMEDMGFDENVLKDLIN
ncbi:hypothetical protein QL285_029453 [Trifolium repens]|nr:hypothetical protein QL285_029453 [Trifolium repens]